MSQPSFARTQIKYWIGLVLILLVLIVIAWNTVSSFHNSQITEIESESEQHIQFLRDIIQEKLQDKNYTSVESLLYQWGEQHSQRIAEVTLVMANGFVLGAYSSETIPAHRRSFSMIIPFSYQDSATLNLLVNLESAYTRTRELSNILGFLIVAFSLFLTIMMWLFLRKKSLTIELKGRSDFLSNTVVNLKSEIIAREEAENAVVKSERKFRLLADHTQDWEYLVEPDGKYLYLSPACEKLPATVQQNFRPTPSC
ncbi:MAG: hypothetical protein J7K90_02060 [Desulfuromusa sp.]|nr:hypothetical protein [Desulfuromusa sp.]